MRGSWKPIAAATGLVVIGTVMGIGWQAVGQPVTPPSGTSSYMSVNEDNFGSVFDRMRAAKASVMKRQLDLLSARYDLSDRPVPGVTMSRGKPIQDGVRVKLPAGVTWDTLATMAADDVRNKGLFPAGFMPLPHPNHPEGGMVFPVFQIDGVKKQTGRSPVTLGDLIRTDEE